MRVKIGDFLKPVRNSTTIQSDVDYKQVTVRMNNQGVCLRGIKKGSEIKTKKQFLVEPGQFILSKIDARNGAFGLVPEDLAGAIVTQDFPTYSINQHIIDKDYLVLMSSSGFFLDLMRQSSSGTTNRKRLKEGKFLNIEIDLPDPDTQRALNNKARIVIDNLNSIELKLSVLYTSLDLIYHSFLTNVYFGNIKLVTQESASKLLENILLTKNNWVIQQKKIGNSEARNIEKKSKKNTNIEGHFKLPEGWCWASLFDASLLVVDCHNKTAPYSAEGIKLVRTTNIKDGRLNLTNTNFVSEETYKRWSQRCPPESGDILFTREAPIGEVGIIPDGEKVCMGQRMMLIRPVDEIIRRKYLFLILRSKEFIKQLTTNQVGLTVKHLRVRDVEQALIPIPPLKQQDAIICDFEKLELRKENLKLLLNRMRLHLVQVRKNILGTI